MRILGWIVALVSLFGSLAHAQMSPEEVEQWDTYTATTPAVWAAHCRDGEPYACALHGERLLFETSSKTNADAAEALRKACDGGSALGCHSFAYQAFHGTPGFVLSGGEIFSMYERACRLGHAKSCIDLADALFKENNPTSTTQAVRALSHGCAAPVFKDLMSCALFLTQFDKTDPNIKALLAGSSAETTARYACQPRHAGVPGIANACFQTGELCRKDKEPDVCLSWAATSERICENQVGNYNLDGCQPMMAAMAEGLVPGIGPEMLAENARQTCASPDGYGECSMAYSALRAAGQTQFLTDLLPKTCAFSDPVSCLEIAQMHQDPNLELAYLEQICKAGHAFGCLPVAQKNPRSFPRWYELNRLCGEGRIAKGPNWNSLSDADQRNRLAQAEACLTLAKETVPQIRPLSYPDNVAMEALAKAYLNRYCTISKGTDEKCFHPEISPAIERAVADAAAAVADTGRHDGTVARYAKRRAHDITNEAQNTSNCTQLLSRTQNAPPFAQIEAKCASWSKWEDRFPAVLSSYCFAQGEVPPVQVLSRQYVNCGNLYCVLDAVESRGRFADFGRINLDFKTVVRACISPGPQYFRMVD